MGSNISFIANTQTNSLKATRLERIMNIRARINLSELDNSNQSATRRLEMMLPQIEAYFAQGVRQKDVVSLLNSQGFELSLDYFKIILKRIRRRNNISKPVEEIGNNLTSEKKFEPQTELGNRPSVTEDLEKKKRVPIVTTPPEKKVFKFDPHAPVKW